MFGALLMPQGVGLFAGCGTALLSMKRKQSRDEEDPEPNPDPPDCAGYGASPSEGKRQMLGRMAQNRCEELNPTMYFCSLACPAHPWLTLGLCPLALAQRRKRASLNACRFAGAVLDDDDQTLQPQQAPEAPGTSAGPSTAEQPHTSPTEQQSTATLMPPRTYADAVMAQTPVLAQPLPALAVPALQPLMATCSAATSPTATSTALIPTATSGTASPASPTATPTAPISTATSTAMTSTAITSTTPISTAISTAITSTAITSTAPISTAAGATTVLAQTLQPQQAPEAPGTSAGSSTAEQPHTSPTEQQSTATLMPPRTYADALMAQNPVLAQPVRTVVAQPLPPSTAQRPLGPPSSQPPPELMMPSMSPFYPSTTATGAACTSGNASTQTLQSIFMTRVMCDFTPRRPSSLPTWKWATLEQLLDRLALHSPREVFQLGPNSLRQLITEWYKDHPAFAGLPYTAWGKRLKDMDPAAHPRSLVFKFSFEYTPAGQPLPMPPSPPSRPAGPGGPSSSAGYSATYFGP